MQVAAHASIKCTAHNRDGAECRSWAIHGGRVCGMHGGRAPHVKQAAEARMQALVHPAISALEQLIADNDLAAAKYVLDYAGFKATEKVQQDGHVTLEIELVKRTLELDQPES
jgi:hypothetical protein